MGKKRGTKSEARQRIIETGERLFYAEGIRAVGIDRIIAESEVAKMTLYNHFSSKDELILAVLQYREEKFDALFDGWMQRRIKRGKNRFEAFFGALKDWFESKGFRGCAFINASVELADAKHPASKFSAEHKTRFHGMLKEIIVDTYGEPAGDVAHAICLLVEGAIVSAVMEQSVTPAEVAHEGAVALLQGSGQPAKRPSTKKKLPNKNVRKKK